MKMLIFLALLCLIILWPLTRYAIFLISNYRSGHLRYIREQLGELFRPILRGVVTAMAAEAIAIPAYPLAWLSRSDSQESGIPVLMVHGLFHNRSAWFLFKRRLRKAGFRNLHTYQYNSFTKDFSQAVDGLEKTLDNLLGARADSKVILVGHSQGGLVARCAADNPRFRDRVAAMVTLGSPHGGSDLAWFGTNKMSRDLIPGRFTSEAVAKCTDPDCPKLGIYTLVDDFVFPLPTLQTGRDGWQEKICSPMGHVWMVYSKEVADMAIEFLTPFKGAKS